MSSKKPKHKIKPVSDVIVEKSITNSVEYQVEQYLIKGYSPSEIAARLGISKEAYWQHVKELKKNNDKDISELCAANMMNWVMTSYKDRLRRLWEIHDGADEKRERSLKLSCLRMIKEEEEQFVTIAGKLGFFSEGSDEVNEYIKKLYSVLSVLSTYQRDRILEIILKSINTSGVSLPVIHEVIGRKDGAA